MNYKQVQRYIRLTELVPDLQENGGREKAGVHPGSGDLIHPPQKSEVYLAEHEAELADYRAAKATMGELLGGEKLPKMAELKEKRRQLAARKKALYAGVGRGYPDHPEHRRPCRYRDD